MAGIPITHTAYSDGIEFSKAVMFAKGWSYAADPPTPPALGTLFNTGLIMEVKINPTGFDSIEAGGMPFEGPLVSRTKGGTIEISGIMAGTTLENLAFALGSDLTADGMGASSPYHIDLSVFGRYATIQLVVLPSETTNEEIANSDTAPIDNCTVFSFRKVKIDPSAAEFAVKHELERIQLPFKGTTLKLMEDDTDPQYGMSGLIYTGVSMDVTIGSTGYSPA